ncbi:hypothetical protein Droror1_Dr00017278 [Drosera rotundifolia]
MATSLSTSSLPNPFPLAEIHRHLCRQRTTKCVDRRLLPLHLHFTEFIKGFTYPVRAHFLEDVLELLEDVFEKISYMPALGSEEGRKTLGWGYVFTRGKQILHKMIWRIKH